MTKRLNTELNSIKDKIIKYSKTDTSKKYYNDEGIEVTNKMTYILIYFMANILLQSIWLVKDVI